MSESRGYAAGQSAMRACLAAHFTRWTPSTTFNCAEIIYRIQQAPGPDA